MRHSLVFVGLLLAAGSALAHDRPAPRQLSVSGSAEQWVEPDIASLRLSVEGRDDSAAAALTQAATRSEQVIQALANLTAARFIRATDTQLHRVVKGTNRPWRRDSSEAVEMLARRDIQVQRLAIDRLPDAMQALARLNLARIDQVTSRHAAARQVRDRLMLLAIDDAKARAGRMAEQLGVELGLPLTVSQQDGSPHSPPALRSLTASVESGDGYQATGSQRLKVQVNIVFELLPP